MIDGKKGEPGPLVLISPNSGGMTSNGTGFIVRREGDVAEVLTCSHVVSHSSQTRILVNGREPCSIETAYASAGVDIALIKVKDLPGTVLPVDGTGFNDDIFSYYGYSKLFIDDYMRARVDVRMTRMLKLQHAGAKQDFLAFEIATLGNDLVQPGHSGAPLLAVGGGACAIVSHRLGDGRAGLAIALADALRRWPQGRHLVRTSESEALEAENSNGAERIGRSSDRPRKPGFPPLPEPTTTDPEDDNADRFGPQEAAGYRLRGELKGVSDKSFFVFDLIVERVDKEEFQADAVRFILHSSFEPRTYVVRRRKNSREIRLEDISSFGVFTVGAQVRVGDQFVLLGYNIISLEGLPRDFFSR